MKIIVERINNPTGEFWIWDKKITNNQDGRIFPSTTSNVGSGESVAIYRKDDNDNRAQIAQLQLPDYKKLFEYYSTGKKINLNYTYIDNFAWLGDDKPYEVENLPYNQCKGFSACCAFFNYIGKKRYVHIMQLLIENGDLDFSYAGFLNLNLAICNLTIKRGNLVFNSAQFYFTNISLGTIVCGGTSLFFPEISFKYITADTVSIETMVMSKKISMDFLSAKTNNTTISLDILPATFNEICLINAVVDKVIVSNAEIDSLNVRDAQINSLELKRCKFLGPSEIAGDIKELCINNCLNLNILKLSLPQTEKLTFSETINSGKICFKDFMPVISAMAKLYTISGYDAKQLLMLKENFRQTGEYENEDICHLHFHKLKTKHEKNILKKLGRHFLDVTSGYGTKPFRMLGVILVTILLFGTLYYFVPCLSYHGVNTWLEHVYASGITFFAVGYGDLFPLNILTKMVSLIEAFLGVTATSYFLVLLSRKIIR